MNNAYYKIPKPINEPIKSFLPGSPERISLKAELEKQASEVVHIPLIIGGKEYFTENTKDVVMPHDHSHVLAKYSVATPELLKLAVEEAKKAKAAWFDMPFEHRSAIFLAAAELISGPYRDLLLASTMLGQSKTVFQAEIDAACELIDFLRFNSYNASQIFAAQPENTKATWNRSTYMPLDGFVAAISPFNFTAIGGNLCSAPAVVGNTVLWKPSSTSVLSNYYYMKILMEAGLPAGVINFVPCSGVDMNKYVISDKDFAGLHFTGSTGVFRTIWTDVGKNIANYNCYPRLVGETGGKDFVFAHKTANVDALVTALIKGAFEYQGQKCSAASRAFIPQSIWCEVKEKLLAKISELKVGDVRDFTTFMSAVIDKKSYDKITGYIKRANESTDTEVICGSYDDSKGYFVNPTVIVSKTYDSESMVDEIFGPVLSIYVYEDEKLDETLDACDKASPYALTGAIFAKDREAIIMMSKKLQNAAGNFYINDKPTGSVVNQQPFGGGRASGTNDKAGSILNMYRWLNQHVTKETLCPIYDITYPYMSEE